MTHFATADELDDGGFFDEQLERFARWAGPLKREQPELIVHAANSAAVLRRSEAHFDMVRCGISVYGMDPFGEDPAARGLQPALELSSRVAEVKPCAPGQSAGYGRRFVAEGETVARAAADRLRRRLAARALGQRRRADRRPALPAGRHGQHGQRHRRPRAPGRPASWRVSGRC